MYCWLVVLLLGDREGLLLSIAVLFSSRETVLFCSVPGLGHIRFVRSRLLSVDGSRSVRLSRSVRTGSPDLTGSGRLGYSILSGMNWSNGLTWWLYMVDLDGAKSCWYNVVLGGLNRW